MDPREHAGGLSRQLTPTNRWFYPDFADSYDDDDDFEPYGPDTFLGDIFPVTLSGDMYSQLELAEKLFEDEYTEYEVYRY